MNSGARMELGKMSRTLRFTRPSVVITSALDAQAIDWAFGISDLGSGGSRCEVGFCIPNQGNDPPGVMCLAPHYSPSRSEIRDGLSNRLNRLAQSSPLALRCHRKPVLERT